MKNAVFGYLSMIVSCFAYFIITTLYSRNISTEVFSDYFIFYQVFTNVKIMLSHLFLNSNQDCFLRAIYCKNHEWIKNSLKILTLKLSIVMFVILYLARIIAMSNSCALDCYFIIFLSIFSSIIICSCFIFVLANQINQYYLILSVESVILAIINFIFITHSMTLLNIIVMNVIAVFFSSIISLYFLYKKFFIGSRCTKSSENCSLKFNKNNLFLDTCMFFLETPSIFVPYFVSSESLLCILCTFRLYNLGCMIPQKYIDSQQGLIMQSYKSVLDGRALYKKLIFVHFVLAICAFFFIAIFGKSFMKVWLNISIDMSTILILALFVLLRNIKSFFQTFLFCYHNKFCSYMYKINFLEILLIFIAFVTIKFVTCNVFYGIYIFVTFLSVVFLRCFLIKVLKLR